MTLQTCLDIGVDCGLDTIGEALFNIELHAICIFDYSTLNEELNQLKEEANKVYIRANFSDESSIQEVIDWLKLEENGRAENAEH